MDLTFHSRGYLHFGVSERVAEHLHPTYHLPGAPAAAGYLPSLSPNKEGGQAHQEEDSSKCIQGILGVDGLLPLHAMSLSPSDQLANPGRTGNKAVDCVS